MADRSFLKSIFLHVTQKCQINEARKTIYLLPSQMYHSMIANRMGGGKGVVACACYFRTPALDTVVSS